MFTCHRPSRPTQAPDRLDLDPRLRSLPFDLSTRILSVSTLYVSLSRGHSCSSEGGDTDVQDRFSYDDETYSDERPATTGSGSPSGSWMRRKSPVLSHPLSIYNSPLAVSVLESFPVPTLCRGGGTSYEEDMSGGGTVS